MNSAIIRDANILGGVPVFQRTRVPFQALLDYLEGGQTLDVSWPTFPPSPAKLPSPAWSRLNLCWSLTCNEAPARRMRSCEIQFQPGQRITHLRHRPEAGLAGKTNGELLALVEARFDVFITLDKGFEYQQNLAGRRISIVLIRAESN